MSNFARIASVVSVYAGAVGFLYLWGFWGRFGVNFLKFATLADLFRLSLMPIVQASLFAIVMQAIQLWVEPIGNLKVPGASTRGLPLWKRLIVVLLIGGFVALMYWRIFVRDEPLWWLMLGFPAAFWAMYRAREDGLVPWPGASEWTQGIVIFGGVLLLFLSYGNGAARSKSIEEGERSTYLDTAVWNGGALQVRGHRYLGTLGEYAFFLTEADTVIIAQWDEIAPLELRRTPRKTTDSPGRP